MSHTSTEHEVLAVVFQVGDATSRKPTLNVLLWQRAMQPERGLWSLPGGRLRADEDLTTSVRRQLAEKVDLREIAHLEQLAVFSDPHRVPGVRMEFYHAYKLIFLCTITGGEACPSNETSAVDFFDLEHLPPLSNYRTSRQMLDEVFAHFADPARPAAFD